MDMTESIAPKSDQLDAIELVSGPRTFTITKVEKNSSPDQPVNVHLAEFPRVWRPGKSMRRVLVAAWGTDATKYVGQRVTLYCDQTVQFGNDTVGGTRISHMSGLEKPLKTPLLVKRGKSAVFTVQPLKEAPKAAPAVTGEIPQDVIDNATKAKADGALDQYVAYLTERGAPEFIIEYARSI